MNHIGTQNQRCMKARTAERSDADVPASPEQRDEPVHAGWVGSAELVRRHGIYSRDGSFRIRAYVCFRPKADIRRMSRVSTRLQAAG